MDALVADFCSRLIAEAIAQGQTPGLGDVLIAATAQVHGLKVATLNAVGLASIGGQHFFFTNFF